MVSEVPSFTSCLAGSFLGPTNRTGKSKKDTLPALCSLPKAKQEGRLAAHFPGTCSHPGRETPVSQRLSGESLALPHRVDKAGRGSCAEAPLQRTLGDPASLAQTPLRAQQGQLAGRAGQVGSRATYSPLGQSRRNQKQARPCPLASPLSSGTSWGPHVPAGVLPHPPSLSPQAFLPWHQHSQSLQAEMKQGLRGREGTECPAPGPC